MTITSNPFPFKKRMRAQLAAVLQGDKGDKGDTGDQGPQGQQGNPGPYIRGYATKAAMDADLAHADGTLAQVTNDSTAASNGMYRKTGASGTGSWVLAADRLTSLDYRFAIFEDGVIGFQTIGRQTPVSSASAVGNQTYVYPNVVEDDGYVEEIYFYALAAGPVKIKVVTIAGGTITFVREITVTAVIGFNTFTFDGGTLPVLRLSPGDYIAVYSAAALARTVASSQASYYNVAGEVTTTAALPALSTAYRLEMRIKCAKAAVDLSDVAGVQDRLGNIEGDYVSQLIGMPTPDAGALTYPSNTVLLDYVLKERGYLTTLKINARSEGTIKVKVFNRDGSIATVAAEHVVPVAAGDQTLSFPGSLPFILAEAGQYVGIYGVGTLGYSTVADNSATTRHFNVAGDSAGWTLVTANTTSQFKLGFTFATLDPVNAAVADGELIMSVVPNAFVRAFMYSGAGYWCEHEISKVVTVGTALGGSANTWRMNGIWKCVKSRDNRFTRVFPVTPEPVSGIGSEMDFALQEAAAADFVGGGVHGFEQLDSFVCVLDGQVVDLTLTATYTGRRLEVLQASRLYNQGTDVSNVANKLATLTKTLDFFAGAFTTELACTFNKSATLTNFYVGMMPMARIVSAAWGGVQATDRGSHPVGGWPVLDLTSGAVAYATGTNERITVWGRDSKLRADVSVLAGFNDATRGSRISVTLGATGNTKIYHSFLGSAANKAVGNGDSFTFKVAAKVVTG